MNGFTVRYSLTVSSESRTQKRDTLKVNLRIEPSIKCCTVTTFNETLLITHENIFAGAINANFSLTSFFKFFFFLFLSFFWLQLADYFFFRSDSQWKEMKGHRHWGMWRHGFVGKGAFSLFNCRSKWTERAVGGTWEGLWWVMVHVNYDVCTLRQVKWGQLQIVINLNWKISITAKTLFTIPSQRHFTNVFSNRRSQKQ